MSDTEKPCLRRNLDLVQAAAQDGTVMIVVRDPFELSDSGNIALRSEALSVLMLLDGSRTVEQIKLELLARSARAGQLTPVPREVLDTFIGQLDQAYLLDNGRYHEARRALVEEFGRLGERPPVLAGRAYPDNRDGLIKFLDEILAEAPQEWPPGLAGKKIPALVAPHVEIRTGRKLYAAAYGAVRGRSYDRVIVLGVGHSLESGLFSLTGKDFLTPLGRVETDRRAVEALRRAAGSLAAGDDFAHRREHSVEFQLIFLQHLLVGPFTIVPVLCGSLFEHLVQGGKTRPRQVEELVPALDCLAGLLRDRRKKTLVVAGVDFSHIGPKFGDNQPAIRIASLATSHDKALLAALAARDVETFCAESRRTGDRYHVCGFSALSMLLEILPEKARGIELGHHIWHETPTQSAVSFAAAAFYTG
ncbi:MAG: AmmeMemoRadiSam system protein B [Candidatus Glassbacteria bacterium]|nr:AmmeMemoRadiSam system protein B [Candidatus Glassbacteria bacterium]